jgi:ribosomal protein L23
MAFFGGKKKDTEVKGASADIDLKLSKKTAPATKAPDTLLVGRDLSHVLRKPRITEKGVLAIDKHVHTFEIDAKATKYDVRDAVIAYYKVTPTKVRIVNRPSRRHMSRARSRMVTAQGLKKAYVYLREDDRIDLV